MIEENKHIDNLDKLFKEKLGGQQTAPVSPQAWKGVSKAMKWRNFLKFNPAQFNVYYALVGTAMVGITVFQAPKFFETERINDQKEIIKTEEVAPINEEIIEEVAPVFEEEIEVVEQINNETENAIDNGQVECDTTEHWR